MPGPIQCANFCGAKCAVSKTGRHLDWSNLHWLFVDPNAFVILAAQMQNNTGRTSFSMQLGTDPRYRGIPFLFQAAAGLANPQLSNAVPLVAQ